MSDQVVLQEAEIRRAALLDRALADGKGIEEALALAARAEGFITGVIAPEAILQIRPALPAPVSAGKRRISLKGRRVRKGARQVEPVLQAIIQIIGEGSRATGPIIAARTGIGVYSIRKAIKQLKEAARIRTVGKTSGVHYVLIDDQVAPSVDERAGKRGAQADLDPAFAAVMADVVAWLAGRGEAVGRDEPTGGYLFRGDNLTAHQLVGQANAVRGHLGLKLFVLPDVDLPAGTGMGTAAALVVEAAP